MSDTKKLPEGCPEQMMWGGHTWEGGQGTVYHGRKNLHLRIPMCREDGCIPVEITPVGTRARLSAPVAALTGEGLLEAAKAFFNLTIADPEVLIRTRDPEKQKAIVLAGGTLRSLLSKPAPPSPERDE